MKRKRLSKRHKQKISRALKRRGRRNTEKRKRKQKPDNTGRRFKDAETASKIVRNIALASESPSKIARNASVTAKNISNITYRSDRNIRRLQKTSTALDSISRIANRSRRLF